MGAHANLSGAFWDYRADSRRIMDRVEEAQQLCLGLTAHVFRLVVYGLSGYGGAAGHLNYHGFGYFCGCSHPPEQCVAGG